MSAAERIVRFSMPYVDKEEIDEVADVIRSGWWTTGRVARRFEQKFAGFIGCKYSVAVNSGTAALHLALKSIGVGKGDEVIVPTMTFTATAEVVVHCGARPVLCDCDFDTLNIDIDDLGKKITKKTKAIIPVHMAGLICRMDEINRIAGRHGIYVIEDAAHALGGKYKGKNAGALGDLAAFSFYVTKPISTGEGGMLVTDNGRLASLARSLSLHGMTQDAWSRYSLSGNPFYKVTSAGFKYNLPDILAALGAHQLKKARLFLRIRRRFAKMYTDAFESTVALETPASPKGLEHAWHLYIVRLNPQRCQIDRDVFIKRLRAEGVNTGVHFMPLHMHPFYRKTFGLKRKDFPNASTAFERIVSLPLYPSMRPADVKFVISKVFKILKKAKRVRGA